MDVNVQAFLTGVAIGGVSYVMFEANQFVLKRLWGANCMAAKMAWKMIKGVAQERAEDEGKVKVVVEIKRETETESEVIESES